MTRRGARQSKPSHTKPHRRSSCHERGPWRRPRRQTRAPRQGALGVPPRLYCMVVVGKYGMTGSAIVLLDLAVPRWASASIKTARCQIKDQQRDEGPMWLGWWRPSRPDQPQQHCVPKAEPAPCHSIDPRPVRTRRGPEKADEEGRGDLPSYRRHQHGRRGGVDEAGRPARTWELPCAVGSVCKVWLCVIGSAAARVSDEE